jgi:hypothetical protein
MPMFRVRSRGMFVPCPAPLVACMVMVVMP